MKKQKQTLVTRRGEKWDFEGIVVRGWQKKKGFVKNYGEVNKKWEWFEGGHRK